MHPIEKKKRAGGGLHWDLTWPRARQWTLDLKFIGSGESVKAILYYISDYITKSQLKIHVTYAALELVVDKLGEYDSEADKLMIHSKRLLQKLGFLKGMGSNIWLFKVENGEYGGADEPQKPQNFVKPSKWPLEWCPYFTTDVSLSTFCQELKYAKGVLLSHKVLLMFNLQLLTSGVGEKDVGIIGHI